MDLTVVMPVHNTMPFLAEAVESILGQSFGDFEFIIGDDGSNDGTQDCLQQYAKKDRRIKLLRRDQKSGPVESSNWVANAAKTELVARMDGDDVAVKTRLERQMQVMREFPEAALVGSLSNLINAQGIEIRSRNFKTMLLTHRPPIAHSSALYRNLFFKKINGYAEDTDYFEDIIFYRRMSELGDILILPDLLLKVRYGGASARLNDDVTKVENSLNRFYHHEAAIQKGSPPVKVENNAKRVAPEVLWDMAVFRVMSSQSANILPRLFWRADLDFSRYSVFFLIRAFGLTFFPSFALRRALQKANLQNQKLAADFRDEHVFKWNPAGHPISLGHLSSVPGLKNVPV